MKAPEPTEHAEQCAIITWAALNASKWPALHLLYAVPNGAFFGGEVKTFQSGKQVPVAAIRGRKLRAEGLKDGVPDLCLPVRSPQHAGLYIELKRRTLGQPSAMQNWWREALIAAGYHAILCRGADAAIEALRNYLKDCPRIELPPLPAAKPAKPRKNGIIARYERRIRKPKAPAFLYPGSPS